MFVSPIITSNQYIGYKPQNRGLSYPNLAPLSKDMVCFTGGKKDMNKEDLCKIDKNTARKIEADARQSYLYLGKKLHSIFDDLVRPATGKGSLSNPIESITGRIKDANSIREKAATRNLASEQDIKREITDIVGARIVLADTSREAVDKVIRRLTEAVNNNEIKITEIENYRPEPDIDEEGNIIKTYDYASAKALKELKMACDDKSESSIKKVDEDVPSGYMAIHLLVQLPNGFTGEIQIIGNEVERLKDVEDMCFKVKNGKHLKSEYKPVEKMLSPLANKSDEILRKEYSIYTRQAYVFQREIEMYEPYNSRNKTKQDFLHIPEYLPEQLDFNNVYKKMQECKGAN